MKKIELSNGLILEYNPKIATDIRFFEAIAEAEENETKVFKVINLLLGKEQKEKLYKSCEEDGYVSAEKVLAFLFEMFEKIKDLKN